ncbi:MAG: hypothetical protein LBS96_05740 [Oscillospiraceae bacterium]|nr:hypothetical protein [Oscillospiraceae bacterium]
MFVEILIKKQIFPPANEMRSRGYEVTIAPAAFSQIYQENNSAKRDNYFRAGFVLMFAGDPPGI